MDKLVDEKTLLSLTDVIRKAKESSTDSVQRVLGASTAELRLALTTALIPLDSP